MKWHEKHLRASWNPEVILTTYWESAGPGGLIAYKIAKVPNAPQYSAYYIRVDDAILISHHDTVDQAKEACLEHYAALPW